MWNGRRSLSLSKFCVLVFMIILILVAASAPWLTRWFFDFSRADLIGTEPFFLLTIYSGCIPAAVLLISLYRLLRRIETGEVFILQNVESLRWISWSSFLGALICLLSVIYYFPWVFVAVPAAFMGLIVRVVKNVVAQAVELKNEIDFTV